MRPGAVTRRGGLLRPLHRASWGRGKASGHSSTRPTRPVPALPVLPRSLGLRGRAGQVKGAAVPGPSCFICGRWAAPSPGPSPAGLGGPPGKGEVSGSHTRRVLCNDKHKVGTHYTRARWLHGL